MEGEKVYIFSYGYNSPKQVTNLWKVTLNEILETAIPCTLKGFKRVFAGIDDYFGNKRYILSQS